MLRLNLRTKLVLAFGLIALVSSAAIELTTSARLHSYFATSTTEKNAQILQRFNSDIESDLDSVQKTLTYLAFNVTVQDYFATGETLTQREQLDQIYEVEEMLGTMLSYNNLITAVNLFPAKWADRIYVDKSAYFSLPDYPYEKDWYLELAEGKSVKTSYISETRTSKTRYNMVRKVLDPATSEWIGIVVVSYDIENLDAFAGAFDLGDEGIVAVYDQDQIIYRTDNGDDTEYGQALRGYRSRQDGSSVEKLAGRDTLVNSVHSDITGWLILSAIPMDYINRALRQVIFISYIVFACTLLATVLVFLQLSKTISRPIASLKTHMQQVMVGDFTAHMHTKRTDEIGDIIKTFNQMTRKLNELITTVYETELKQKDSENRALQAQINPHFLYNTLESIRMLAVLNDDDDVSTAIRYLGMYLRYAMDWSKRFVTLGEELAHLKNYLTIYQLKNASFTFEQQVPEDLFDYQVIKMCLQPLVENSIEHGLKNKPNGVLRVRAGLDGDSLVIVVSDNGVGMPQRDIERLQAMLDGDFDDTSANIGLMNIQHRLRLLFGSTGGLRLRRGEDGGMDVVLTMVAVRAQKENLHV